MIDPKVLRPGNWIHCKGSSHYGIVTGDLLALLEKEEKMREKFEYIELTGELLEAAGFEKRHSVSRVHKLLIAYEDTDYPCSLQSTADGIQICRSGVGAITAHIKYLHELQNLFFILIGSELPLPESAKLINQVIPE